MGNFRSDRSDRENRSGGRSRGGYGNRSSGYGGRSESRGSYGRDRDRRDSRPREMHDVTCDKCGKQCQVPFRPSGDKPVLCSDCFRAKEGSSNNFSSKSSSGASSDQMNQINKKLDKIITILQDLELDVEGDGESEEDLDEEEEAEEDEEDEEDSDK